MLTGRESDDYICKRFVSEVGFEPTPTFVDQNTRYEGYLP